ncbi:MAP3K12-binding inhibitory protein 1-like [Argiope bruennichi]|uniref:MAP3K12-binding inhibitory protein 1-like n=1 Tax=Argiope bruennichi TaxID=94029 RepID=UPI002495584B|nr:MAP3K12-binding inhibitory protein 1-like [Argiope bruennichi]
MQNTNPLHPIIPAVESFLKELQNIGIIKEYSLQAAELGSSKVNEFQSAFLKFSQKVNETLILHNKTTENPDIEVSNVSEINSEHQPVQIEDNKNISNSKNLQQLQVDETEIKRRINAFLSRKRKEVDEWNVQEFCSRPYVEEENPLWEQVDSCARVDAVFIPRFGSKSHVKVSKVENRWGPQTQFRNEPAKRIKTEPGLESETETNDVTFETIQERLRIMESHLKLKSDSSMRNSIFQRIKKLEDRILFLEGISPDYFHLSAPNYSSANKKSISEKEKVYSNWNVDDIQKRIQALKESLKMKSVVKKEPVP